MIVLVGNQIVPPFQLEEIQAKRARSSVPVELLATWLFPGEALKKIVFWVSLDIQTHEKNI